MSETVQNLKNIVMKGIEVISNKANDFASGARQRVDVYNLENKREELLTSIGSHVFSLSEKGTLFPDEIEEVLKEIRTIDAELSSIQAAGKQEGKPAEESAETDRAPVYEEPAADSIPDEEPSAAEYTAENDTDIPVIQVETDQEEQKDTESCPLSSAINDLFEKTPQMDKMMDKVNNSLDELGDNLLKFSGEFDRQLNDFADQMMGKEGKDNEK